VNKDILLLLYDWIEQKNTETLIWAKKYDDKKFVNPVTTGDKSELKEWHDNGGINLLYALQKLYQLRKLCL